MVSEGVYYGFDVIILTPVPHPLPRAATVCMCQIFRSVTMNLISIPLGLLLLWSAFKSDTSCCFLHKVVQWGCNADKDIKRAARCVRFECSLLLLMLHETLVNIVLVTLFLRPLSNFTQTFLQTKLQKSYKLGILLPWIHIIDKYMNFPLHYSKITFWWSFLNFCSLSYMNGHLDWKPVLFWHSFS